MAFYPFVDGCVLAVVDSDFLLKNVSDIGLRRKLYNKEKEYYEDLFYRLEKQLGKALGDKNHQEYIVKELLNKRMKKFAEEEIKIQKKVEAQEEIRKLQRSR